MAKTKSTHGQELLFEKPPFRLPTMPEIEAVAGTNGFNVVSTFSGCGGSSLGLKQAGYRVLWANEFVPEAANTYVANNPGTYLSRKDIREIRADEIAYDIYGAFGETIEDLDLFEGSPPCASFSTAGRREEHWGKVKQYSDVKQRVDDLFDEYVRLVGELRPKVFLAENVTGLIKGVARGYLNTVLKGFAQKGYRVHVKVLDAQWLGVPQRRQRVIFIGVRNDIPIDPVVGFPQPLHYRYTVQDALDTLPPDSPVEPEADMTRYEVGKEWLKLRPGQQSDRYFSLVRSHPLEPSPTITQTGGVTSAAAVTHPHQCRKFSVAEARVLCGFPPDFHTTGSYKQQYERFGRAVPPPMYKAVGAAIRDNILGVL